MAMGQVQGNDAHYYSNMSLTKITPRLKMVETLLSEFFSIQLSNEQAAQTSLL